MKKLKKKLDEYFKNTSRSQISKDLESLCASAAVIDWGFAEPDDREETLDEILGVK